MPQVIQIEGQDLEVATEDELLEFVNKGRAAGGANVLEALLPATPEDPYACLIAVGLNFSCSVDGCSERDEDGVLLWEMNLPFNIGLEQARTIAAALDCPLGWIQGRHVESLDVETVYRNPAFIPLAEDDPAPYDEPWYENLAIRLPKHIGNAALAFDKGVAFRELSSGFFVDEDDQGATFRDMSGGYSADKYTPCEGCEDCSGC